MDELLEVAQADDVLKRFEADAELVAVFGASYVDAVDGGPHLAAEDLDYVLEGDGSFLFLDGHASPLSL